MYGGMARFEVRTKAVNVSIAMGSGASFGPVTPPCPWKPRQPQQPCWIYAVLPFFADAATAPEDEAGGERRQPTYTHKTHRQTSLITFSGEVVTGSPEKRVKRNDSSA